MQTSDAELYRPDGVRLSLRILGPQVAQRVLVVVHGYGEHGGRYLERLRPLAEQGWRILLPDMRGHGRSSGPRGHVMRFGDYVDDLAAIVAGHAGDGPPLHVLGHSNGGLIALHYVLQHPERIRSAALTSPLLGIAVDAPAWKVAAGHLISRLAPRVSLPSEIDPAVLSHDPTVVREYREDPLNHHVTNTRWYTEALGAMEQAHRLAPSLRVPLLVLQSGEDHLVDAREVARWCDAAPRERVRHEERPGLFHELLFESTGGEDMQRIADWMLQAEGAER